MTNMTHKVQVRMVGDDDTKWADASGPGYPDQDSAQDGADYFTYWLGAMFEYRAVAK